MSRKARPPQPADFAKLVDIFDAQSISFVAITQQFNTTTSMGRLTLITLLLTGSGSGDRFLRIVPIAVFVAQLNVLVVFFHCVRFAGSMQALTSFFVTILSLIPFYIALFIAMSIGEVARPGTIAIFQRVLISPTSLTVFSGGG